MPDILLPIIALLAGFILLIWSADTFTENGAKIANIFKVSPLVIGLSHSFFRTSLFTSIGVMMALTPSTNAILKILEPMALPMLSPVLPSIAEHIGTPTFRFLCITHGSIVP
jgi:hypothetical protein